MNKSGIIFKLKRLIDFANMKKDLGKEVNLTNDAKSQITIANMNKTGPPKETIEEIKRVG